MASLEELREVRLGKRGVLEDDGINPYPAKTNRTHTNKEVVEKFEEIELKNESITLSGRVMALRGQGAISFIPLYDGTATFQGVLKEDQISKDQFRLFKDTVDIGDFIEISGELFITEKGTQSLLVKDWKMLTKGLMPLPDKRKGIQDQDQRYRHRHLDILMNEDVRDVLTKKSLFWKTMRDFLNKKGFLEVETPTLEVTTGGAEATPFATHHNDFDLDVFLRISIGELWQKRLMAAGFPKTFEIGRAYRNEGSSPNHLQEFTNMEFYWAYANYRDGMELSKEMYREIAQKVFGTTAFNVRGHEFDFADEWKEIDYRATVLEKTGIDILESSEEDMVKKLEELEVKYDNSNISRGRLIDTLWKYCRKQISGPAFLVHHPKIVSPLAKESVEKPGTVERFQIIIAGTEVGNGYSELNDPVDQRRRFEEQQALLAAGDTEAMMPDWEFVEMLEHGMPPTCGFGVGERMFAILMDKPIRETVWFPLMKPREEDGKKKKKGNMHATIILNSSSNLEGWQKMNTVGHLCAEFAAQYPHPSKLFYKDEIKTADNEKISLNMQHAIMVREIGDSGVNIKSVIVKAKEQNLHIAEFTREMLETTNDKKVEKNTAEKNYADIEHLGILIFGDSEEVKAIAGDLPLSS